MPAKNRFRHQTYSNNPPGGRYEVLTPGELVDLDSPAYQAELNEARNRLVAADVQAIYLLHGTFAGDDLLGLLGEWERYSPTRAKRWRGGVKRIVDSISGELGNYTAAFANRLAADRQPPADPQIPVRMFSWSGENQHFARVDAAVRLLDELFSREFVTGRILLWGHSHGGNVLALLTNLLAADGETLQRFLVATGYSEEGRNQGQWVRPVWKRVLDKLAEGRRRLSDVKLDIVTFGAPIRYGWDTGGYATLTHFVNHRPSEGIAEYLSSRPNSLEDLRSSSLGDMMQQLGIAGSDFLPSLFAWSNWTTERRLRKFLQLGCRRRDYWKHLSLGMRVPEDGFTWLVDYSNCDANRAGQQLGHSVYTNSQWLPFHAKQIAGRIDNSP